MKNDARSNAFLAVMVLILALIAWYKPGLQQHQFQYLSSLKPENIKTIVIERQGMETIRLIKNNQHWFLQSPYLLPANTLRVKTIQALASKRSYSSFEVAENELKAYALDQPPVRVWLNDEQFELGSEAPLNGQRYTMNIQENINTGKTIIQLINGAVYYQLRAPVDSFISPSLIPAKAEITQIKWLNHQLGLKNGQWQLHTTQENANIQPDSVTRLIQNWQTTQASKVETEIKALLPAEKSSSENSRLEKKRNMDQQTIDITFKHADKEQTIRYIIIQEDSQIKLLRPDLQIAWWISPQQLKLLTEFIPITKTVKNAQ